MATPIPTNAAPLDAWTAAAATGGTIARVHGDGAKTHGVFSDSRAITKDSAFVALRGAAHDAHDFLDAAAKSGAKLLVVARGHGRALPGGVDVVEVDDTLVAWGALAAAHVRAWRRSRACSDGAKLIGITGSAGKTTTKELTAALLSVFEPCHATAGNLNNRVGVPAVAFGLETQHRFAVVEMGMSERGEIATLAAIAEPDVAIVTNVSVAHAEGVGGSRAAVAREKGSIYAALGEHGVAIVNADDAAASGELARSRARRAEFFGRAESASYRLVERTSLGERGSRVVIARASRSGPARITVELPRIGEAAAIDLVAAVAAAEAASGHPITDAIAREAMSALPAPQGRAAPRALADGTLILDDTYNANPVSVRAALDALIELAKSTNRRPVAILGEMRELGACANEEHVSLGDALASAKVALVIGCGGLTSLSMARAQSRGVEAVDAPSVEAAAQEAIARVRPGDAVLVKGSRGVACERVVEALALARARESVRIKVSRPIDSEGSP